MLVATGAHPRVLPDAVPDGERILTWTQVYDLQSLPERLIVVGSGVTGAEFAGAYQALGSQVVAGLQSATGCCPARTRTPPRVIEDVFTRSGMEVLSQSRAASVVGPATVSAVTLTDGRVVEGSHCLLAVGSVPNTERDRARGRPACRRRTAAHPRRPGLAHVDPRRVRGRRLHRRAAARVRRRHAGTHRDVRTRLGDAVAPLELRSRDRQHLHPARDRHGRGGRRPTSTTRASRRAVLQLPLPRNPRAKMLGINDGFVKLFARTWLRHRDRRGRRRAAGQRADLPRSRSPCQHRLTVDQVASTFTVYPSLSGSIAEAARQLHTAVQG